MGSLDPLRPSTPHSPLLLIPLRPSLPSAPHSPPPLIPLCPRSPLSSPTKCLLGRSDFPPPSSLPSLLTQQRGSPWSICPARHLQASPQGTSTLTLTHRALRLPPGPHHPRCRLPLSPGPLCSSLTGLFPASGPLHAQCPLPRVSFPCLRVVGSPGCLTAPKPPALATVPHRPSLPGEHTQGLRWALHTAVTVGQLLCVISISSRLRASQGRGLGRCVASVDDMKCDKDPCDV